ncbi:MAG: hypothetical protein RL608_164 [Bacteroidota bacterium]|jgi:hypothetical protein
MKFWIDVSDFALKRNALDLLTEIRDLLKKDSKK